MHTVILLLFGLAQELMPLWSSEYFSCVHWPCFD